MPSLDNKNSLVFEKLWNLLNGLGCKELNINNAVP